MRFLQKTKYDKTVIVISDLHLGAGPYYKNHRNYLEDFHSDKELVDFLNYYSTNDYASREVELVINGDFFDFLAVPFVEFFEDEFWSEEAAVEKLKLMLDGHREVLEELNKFLEQKNTNLKYILGNHDAELILEGPKKLFLDQFSQNAQKSIEFIIGENVEYRPHPKVVIKHGHEYELAHNFHYKHSVLKDESGKKYFIPPWGSYYVTRLINKFKETRPFVNSVRPIRQFLIHGLIYDTLFTFRFMLAHVVYFVMVRCIFFFKQASSLKEIFTQVVSELEMFQDYELLTKEILEENDDMEALLVGHTHSPVFRTFINGKTFINTGSWTQMHHLDFGKRNDSTQLTYATIDINKKNQDFQLSLNLWKGINPLPFEEF
jgi:UDP-2,3-diacylglucosamine pyrophosphatase LpxH